MKDERNKIRVMLLENNLTHTWLLNRLEENGVIADKTELSSALAGRRKGKKVDTIIAKSLDILGHYEKVMGGSV